jgi:hypothetical protein
LENKESIDQSNISRLIQENISRGKETTALDQPKVEQLEADIQIMTPAMESYINDKALELLYFFGYSKYESSSMI